MNRDSSYRVVDADGKEHWVPMNKPRRGLFGKVIVVTLLLLVGLGAIAHSLPVTQSTSDGELYTSRTLQVPTTVTTTVPSTTKAGGAAALACQALGFR